ncbi:MAG TPA: hypothetical protein VGL56_11570 [Fimbriimonadaceae bacterium]|jgi:hypothetical protein
MKRILLVAVLVVACIGCKGSSTPAPGSGNDYSGEMPSAPSTPRAKLLHSTAKPQATAVGNAAKEGGK